MILTKLRKISIEEAYRLGIPGYVWNIKYNYKTWHLNLKSKTIIGLIFQIIKAYARSHFS